MYFVFTDTTHVVLWIIAPVLIISPAHPSDGAKPPLYLHAIEIDAGEARWMIGMGGSWIRVFLRRSQSLLG